MHISLPDDESKITRVVGLYKGEEFEDIYKEVKRLLTQIYEHQTYMDFGANLADLIEVSYADYENTKWGIHLRVRKSDKSVRLFYYTKQWDADMKFREAVDKIKSENL